MQTCIENPEGLGLERNQEAYRPLVMHRIDPLPPSIDYARRIL